MMKLENPEIIILICIMVFIYFTTKAVIYVTTRINITIDGMINRYTLAHNVCIMLIYAVSFISFASFMGF